MANKNITQLTQQTVSADPTSLFYTVTGIPGNFSDKSLPISVLLNTPIPFTQPVTGGIPRTVQTKLQESKSVADFGVVGDGTTDDTAAFQAALTWWSGASDRWLFVNPEFQIKLTAGVAANCSGIPRMGVLYMFGSIQPVAGIAAAITFTNIRKGDLTLRVYGGGQTANYSQPNPTGGNEAFRFVNAYGTVLDVEGGNYAGRVLRLTSGTVGPDGFQTQWVRIRRLYCNSTAALTAPEATRLAQGVGQSVYIDTQTNAFGSIDSAFLLWELYGPVVDSTTDVTFHDLESLWRGNTGMVCHSVISFWAPLLKLGSGLLTGTMNLITFDSLGQSAADCQNVHLGTIFAVDGYNGIYAQNVGNTSGNGLTIDRAVTRINSNVGITLNNCKKFDITTDQWADGINLYLTGACSEGTVKFRSSQSKNQNILIDSSVSGQIYFSGEASNGNANLGSNIHLIDVQSTGVFFFQNMLASSGNVDYLYGLPVGNTTTLLGGAVTTAGGTSVYNNAPVLVNNVRGLTSQLVGQATITSGTIDGTSLGAITPSSASVTTLTTSSTVNIGPSRTSATGIEIGGTAGTAASAFIDLHSSGNAIDYDSRIVSTGGTGSIGQGALQYIANGGHSFTGIITPTTTTGIKGTTLGDNANAGSVGEYLTATSTSTSLTNGTYADQITLSLTAGDWDVEGTVNFIPAGTTTVTALVGGINTVANTQPTAVGTFFTLQASFTTGGGQVLSTPITRISLASTTTVRLGAQANFGVSTMNAVGMIRARRVR